MYLILFYPRTNTSLQEDRSGSPIFCRRQNQALKKVQLDPHNDDVGVTTQGIKLQVTETKISEVHVESAIGTPDNQVIVRDNSNTRHFKCNLILFLRRKLQLVPSQAQ